MENPATWGDVENVIHDVIVKDHYAKQAAPGLCGLSLPRQIADALRSSGLLGGNSVTRTAVAIARVNRVQAENHQNWSRHGEEDELDELRKLADAVREDMGIT